MSADELLAAFLLEALRNTSDVGLCALIYPERRWYRQVRHHYTELCYALRVASGEDR